MTSELQSSIYLVSNLSTRYWDPRRSRPGILSTGPARGTAGRGLDSRVAVQRELLRWVRGVTFDEGRFTVRDVPAPDRRSWQPCAAPPLASSLSPAAPASPLYDTTAGTTRTGRRPTSCQRTCRYVTLLVPWVWACLRFRGWPRRCRGHVTKLAPRHLVDFSMICATLIQSDGRLI